MIAVFFLIYAAIGVGAGFGLFTYAGIELPLAVGAGAIVTALIGQVHLFATRKPFIERHPALRQRHNWLQVQINAPILQSVFHRA